MDENTNENTDSKILQWSLYDHLDELDAISQQFVQEAKKPAKKEKTNE